VSWWNPVTWRRAHRRRELLSQPIAPSWRPWFARLPCWRTLSPGERERLAGIARVLVAERPFEGCGGLALTEEMVVTISGQAALLLLHLQHDYFASVPSILVYPRAFVDPTPRVDAGGIVHEGSANLGEAWRRGPVVLSWADVLAGLSHRDGRNLVLHEFAHKLDMLDGYADGCPPLKSKSAHRRWHDVMLRAYEELCHASEQGRASLLDAYGATNPAEFFAVATECFFGQPGATKQRHPQLYDVLAAYYRQDPAARDAPGSGDGADARR